MLRAFLGVLAIASLGVVSAAPQPRFNVAVLRRDGLLIPFASYNGRAWSVPWPGAGIGVALPISLGDIPKGWWGDVPAGAAWTAWLPDNEARPVKLIKPVHVPIFCGAHLALATDYRGAALTEREPTVPKDGIATAGEIKVEPITQISVNAPDAAVMVGMITDKFNEEETLAAEHFTEWVHPYSKAMRARAPITLETFYRAIEQVPQGELRTSYVEAVRRYPALTGDNGCGLVTFARAWITEVAGKKPIINLGARVTYCDRADVSFIQPFGRVVVPAVRGKGSDVYWIYQLSSWRDEFYSVAQVSAEGMKPVVVVAGGGCPKEKDPGR
jgi:hypothetical protein